MRVAHATHWLQPGRAHGSNRAGRSAVIVRYTAVVGLFGVFPMTTQVASLPAPGLAPPPVAPLSPFSAAPAGEDIEREINQLTWSVLDGSASASDRQRLAELVKMQHAGRRRAS
jgi:hypothetical protein